MARLPASSEAADEEAEAEAEAAVGEEGAAEEAEAPASMTCTNWTVRSPVCARKSRFESRSSIGIGHTLDGSSDSVATGGAEAEAADEAEEEAV